MVAPGGNVSSLTMPVYASTMRAEHARAPVLASAMRNWQGSIRYASFTSTSAPRSGAGDSPRAWQR